jgi:hypothetical protein
MGFNQIKINAKEVKKQKVVFTQFFSFYNVFDSHSTAGEMRFIETYMLKYTYKIFRISFSSWVHFRTTN